MLPSGLPSRIKSIDTVKGELAEAFPPMSVTVRLEDEVDVSRGDMIARPNNQPIVTQDIDAMICWMDSAPMRLGGKYTIKHTSRSARALVKEIQYELDVNPLHRNQRPETLVLNAIGRITLRTTQPLMRQRIAPWGQGPSPSIEDDGLGLKRANRSFRIRCVR